jgi:hypothetical protein
MPRICYGRRSALERFPQDATAFAEVAARLQAAGMRTLAPHQRGYSPGA